MTSTTMFHIRIRTHVFSCLKNTARHRLQMQLYFYSHMLFVMQLHVYVVAFNVALDTFPLIDVIEPRLNSLRKQSARVGREEFILRKIHDERRNGNLSL